MPRCDTPSRKWTWQGAPLGSVAWRICDGRVWTPRTMRGAVHFPLGPSCMMTTLTELKSDVLDSRPSVWPVIRDRLNRNSEESSVRRDVRALIFLTTAPDSRVSAQVWARFRGMRNHAQLPGEGRMVRGAWSCPTRARCFPLGLRIFSLELGDVRLAQAVKACLDHMTKSNLHGARRVVYVRYVERLSSCPEKWMPCRQPLRHRLRATTR